MIRSIVLALSAVTLLGACEEQKPGWSGRAPEGQAETPARAASGDVEERLARIERRLDKITGFLRQAVRPELDPSPTYGIPVEPHDPVIGPPDAKVTIVEAYEFLCPYCNMVAPTMEKILETYPKEVRIVPKYMLIHGPPAAPSGLAMCAAGKQGKAREMQQALWEAIWPSPQTPDRDKATAESMVAIAGSLGLDTAKFKADLDGPECTEWLTQSQQTLQKFGASGTPAFYVNGRFVGGQSYEGFKKLIDEEIAKADAAIARGVKPGEYYQKEIIGKGEPQAKMISPFDE
jgi:protein-disulfide isomerase